MQFLDAAGHRFVTAFIDKAIADFPQPDRFVYESSKILQAIVAQRASYLPLTITTPASRYS
jgi:hypothetical protein